MHLSTAQHCQIGKFENRTFFGFLKLCSTLLFFCLLSLQSIGQLDAYPKATLNEQGIVQLPLDQELGRTYLIDLEGMTFGTETEMVEFFSGFSDELFIYRALPGQQKAVLMVRRDAHPDWTVSEWNTRLQACCEQKPVRKP